ncbi:MAG: transposase family protein, partial [Treponema sp.]|nr:transposase family protein [Treponema sp.]
MEITVENIREMGKYLGERGEPRRTAYGNIRHKVPDIMVIGFTATLCNHDEFEEMEAFGRLKQDFFKGFLELPNGIPDESTFRMVSAWVGEQNLRLGELVTEEKSNEIRAVPELLDMLDIRRDVVT